MLQQQKEQTLAKGLLRFLPDPNRVKKYLSMNLLFSMRSLEPLLVLYLPVVAVNYHTFLCDYKIQTSFSDQEEIAVGCLGGNFGRCLPQA